MVTVASGSNSPLRNRSSQSECRAKRRGETWAREDDSRLIDHIDLKMKIIITVESREYSIRIHLQKHQRITLLYNHSGITLTLFGNLKRLKYPTMTLYPFLTRVEPTLPLSICSLTWPPIQWTKLTSSISRVLVIVLKTHSSSAKALQ